MQTLRRLLSKSSMAVWAGVALGGYLSLLFYTFNRPDDELIRVDGGRIIRSAKNASFHPGNSHAGEGHHEIFLESLSSQTGVLAAGYVLRDTNVSDTLRICPVIRHEGQDLDASRLRLVGTEIELVKDSSSAPGGAQELTGRFIMLPELQTHRFPFDKIVVDIHYHTGVYATCKEKPDARIAPPRTLNVVNRIPGYVIDSDALEMGYGRDEDNYIRLQLARSEFLQVLALLVAALAAISTFLLARAIWRRKTKDWSPLAYFIGLWGCRDIFLSLIPDPRPFPTVVDVSALYLFAVILLTWAAAALRGGKNPS